jgi:hypothetical protein
LKDICYEVKTGFLPNKAIMFGTHNIALFGNDIYIISSPNFISYIFDKKYLKIYFHNTLQSLSKNRIINFSLNTFIFDTISGNCKPPLHFSLIIVLYFTKCEPLFHIKLTHAVLISRRAQSGIHVTNNVYHIQTKKHPFFNMRMTLP